MNPFSAIFAAVVAARNALYDRNLLNIRRLSRPVISVGNLSVGGSGKTPFVIAMGELLKERGIAFDVLSRGYRRNSIAVAVVDPLGTPEEFGDEPLLIARKLQVPVVVAADRYRAGLLAEQKFATRLHLLDDAFQHRRLHRDFDIVMFPAADIEDTLLPVGRLREPLSSLQRADAIVVIGGTAAPQLQSPVWQVRRQLSLDLPTDKAIAFCGIARPDAFFSELRKLGVDVAQTIAFRDHHRYSADDLQRLLAAKSESGAHSFITTEKDEINLGSLAAQLQPLTIARLHVGLENPKEAVDFLLKVLKQRSGCGF